MIHAFEVTLVHFAIEEGRAVARKGDTKQGKINTASLRELLALFQAINPVQDFEGEPQILIATRHAKWAVSSDLNRLILYDLKHVDHPGAVCDIESLLHEVDESADEARRRHLRDLGLQEDSGHTAHSPRGEPEPQEAEVPQSRSSPLRLALLGSSAIVACIAAIMVGSPSQQTWHSADVRLADAPEDKILKDWVPGVYMSGYAVGDHGLVLGEDGSVRIFELRGKEAPFYVNDRWSLARRSGQVGVIISQPGSFIAIIDKETVSYCGERYEKVR